eukprot:s695_g15.t1
MPWSLSLQSQASCPINVCNAWQNSMPPPYTKRIVCLGLEFAVFGRVPDADRKLSPRMQAQESPIKANPLGPGTLQPCTARLVVKNSFLELVESSPKLRARRVHGTKSESDLPYLYEPYELPHVSLRCSPPIKCSDAHRNLPCFKAMALPMKTMKKATKGAMKAKAMKAKPMKAMKKKAISKIARGKLAKSVVFNGRKDSSADLLICFDFLIF